MFWILFSVFFGMGSCEKSFQRVGVLIFCCLYIKLCYIRLKKDGFF